MFEEALESPLFWILAGGGVGMEVLGWVFSREYIGEALPLWQLLVMIVVTIIASAYFANQE